MSKRTISIIVPCYNEKDNIIDLYQRVLKVFQLLKKYDFELIFIDNLSTDNSQKIFLNLSKKDSRVKIIIMSRNFGSPQPSFSAGLSRAKGEAAVLLHGDIQDPPELIPELIKKWEEGYDVIYGIRKKRQGYGLLMNFFYQGFYYLLKKLAYVDIPLNAGEFSLLDRKVVNELLKLDEHDYYLRCLRAFVGFKQTGIEYIRNAREKGQSTENFLSGLWWAKTIIVNFSFKPLAWISRIALLVVLAAFLSIIIFLIYYLFNPNSPRGIPTLFILILFLGGIQLLSLSIIAEYLAKIFLEVKKRPRFIIDKIIWKGKKINKLQD